MKIEPWYSISDWSEIYWKIQLQQLFKRLDKEEGADNEN